MNQTVLAAADKAADATWYTDQLTLGGLKAWKPRKVFGSLPAGTLGEVTLETTRLALRLGHSLADYAATPRGLITADPGPAPAALTRGYCGSERPITRAVSVTSQRTTTSRGGVP